MSLNKWMIKETMEHLYYGILLSNKKEWNTVTFNNLDESPGNYAEWIMPILKGYLMHDSIYIMFLKWQHHRDGEQISGCQ